ncbi:hypothetical protein R1sor_020295 [Riccia sorocarpa]|uniref:Uncharacterized protein n=1 Tax=Riccia sorocarpa TaxID=122646 RepID=A0ABD3IF11_9MARC
MGWEESDSEIPGDHEFSYGGQVLEQVLSTEAELAMISPEPENLVLEVENLVVVEETEAENPVVVEEAEVENRVVTIEEAASPMPIAVEHIEELGDNDHDATVGVSHLEAELREAIDIYTLIFIV